MKLKHPELVWTKVDSEVVVLDTRTSRYSSLNESAAELWLALSEGATVAEMEALLQEQYGIEGAVAAEDVSRFLEMLREHDMLDEEN